MSGRRVRFALGSREDQQSDIWQAWTQGDEAYLAPRSLSGFLKISLHSSGTWRSAFVSDSPIVEQLGGDRRATEWERPAEFYPGWTQGPSVLFPSLSPIEWPPEKAQTEKKVTWLDPPDEGWKVTVTLLFAAPTTRPLGPPPTGTDALAELELRTRGSVWVMARRLPMSAEERDNLERFRRERAVDPGVVGPGGWVLAALTSHGAPLFVEMRVPKRLSRKPSVNGRGCARK